MLPFLTFAPLGQAAAGRAPLTTIGWGPSPVRRRSERKSAAWAVVDPVADRRGNLHGKKTNEDIPAHPRVCGFLTGNPNDARTDVAVTEPNGDRLCKDGLPDTDRLPRGSARESEVWPPKIGFGRCTVDEDVSGSPADTAAPSSAAPGRPSCNARARRSGPSTCRL